MTQLGGKKLDKGSYMYRVHAFRWHQMLSMWILSNPHPSFGIDGNAIEQRFHDDLATIVDEFKRDHDSPVTIADWALNRLGAYTSASVAEQNFGNATHPNIMKRMTLSQSSLGYYM
jgi:hypothetical protein